MTKAIRFWVSGRVQGVSFRFYTQREAQRLGLTGWVRNLSDGRVEGLACGAEPALEALSQWLAGGPELSEVSDLAIEPAEVDAPSTFDITR